MLMRSPNEPARVVLFGDSVRLHYQRHVIATLPRTDVWSRPDNDRDSRSLLRTLTETPWPGDVDVIHFNCGLHDLRRDAATEAPTVGVEEYTRNLRCIVEMLSSSRASRIVVATTTPVLEERHNRVRPNRRYEVDVEVYNGALLEIAAEYKLEVNDLFSAVSVAGVERLLGEDGVHFTNSGYQFLGHLVAGVVASAMDGEGGRPKAAELGRLI